MYYQYSVAIPISNISSDTDTSASTDTSQLFSHVTIHLYYLYYQYWAVITVSNDSDCSCCESDIDSIIITVLVDCLSLSV